MNYWLPDKVYDAIKWFVTTALPALSIAYAGYAAALGWPYAEQVTAVIAVTYTLLCSLMGISTAIAKRPLPTAPTDDPDSTAEFGRHLRGE